MLLRAGGVRSVQVGYATEHGLSVSDFHSLIIYLIVVGIFGGLGLIVGRRAGCHTICWMAPFMIAGRFVGRRFGLPGIELQARNEECTKCDTCTSGCPMSLPVRSMVARGKMYSPDCTLCGTCVDRCPKEAIRFGWGCSDGEARGRGRRNLQAAIVSSGPSEPGSRLRSQNRPLSESDREMSRRDS